MLAAPSTDRPAIGPAVLIFLVSVFFSLPYAFQLNEEAVGDMADYEELAMNLLQGRGYVQRDLYRCFRTPGLVFFLAGIYAVWGVRQYLVVRVIQTGMLSLMNVFVFLLGRRLGGVRIGLIAGLLCAVSHELVFWAAKPATEFLYTFFVFGSTAAFVEAVRRPSGTWALLAGLGAGAAFLTRPIMLVVVPLWATGLFYYVFKQSKNPAGESTASPPPTISQPVAARPPARQKPFRLVLCLFTIGFAALSLPWFVRNYMIYHRVFINTNSGLTLWWANHPAAEIGGWYAPIAPTPSPDVRIKELGLNELEVSDQLTEEAIDFMRSRPWRAIQLAVGRIAYMMLGSKELLTASPADRLFCWPGFDVELVKSSWPLLLLSLVGIIVAMCRREPLWWILLLVVVGTLAVHSIYTAVPRMRVPILPILYLFAARGACCFWDYYARLPLPNEPSASGLAPPS